MYTESDLLDATLNLSEHAPSESISELVVGGAGKLEKSIARDCEVEGGMNSEH